MPEATRLDELPADARTRLRKWPNLTWVSPMLATLTEESFSREGWLFEPKLDGERCLALRQGRAVDLFSRNQKRLNEKYPELVSALETQKSSTFVLEVRLWLSIKA